MRVYCHENYPNSRKQTIRKRMRAEHYLGFVLPPCVQALLLLSASTAPQAATAKPFALLALVIPIPCYIWALRDAPIVSNSPRRAVRLASLVLWALGLSFGGFVLGLEMITADAIARQ